MATDASGNTYGIYRADRGYFVLGRTALLSSQAGVESGAVMALQDGSGLQFPPKFLDVPGTANNVLDVSYYQGLYYPTARVAVDVIGGTTAIGGGWFNTANLNSWFMTRGAIRANPGYDDLFAFNNAGCIYSDGNRAITINGAKGDMLSLSARQNDILRCNMSIMGASKTELVWEAVAAPLGQRASWANVNFLVGVTGVIDFELRIMNNCVPNPIMGASTGTAVVEINAGKPRFELSLTVDGRGTFPATGSPIIFTITPPAYTGYTAATSTFTIANPRIDTPDNIQKQGLRAQQRFNIVGESVDGITNSLIIT